MPTVFETNGYRFFFYSNEGDEPIHIHVNKSFSKDKDKNRVKSTEEAKFWIKPRLEEVYAYGFKAKERKEIKKLVEENADKIIEKWNEHVN